MKKSIKPLFYLTLILAICSCNQYPKTPEEVVEKYTQYLIDGDCDAAMGLTIGNAKETVQSIIDTGCESPESKFDSVACNITNNEAICHCYETIETMNMKFPYELEKINDQWKITSSEKDIGMPSMDSIVLGEQYDSTLED